MKKQNKITKESNLAEMVFKYPKTAEVLLDWGLHCVGCGAMKYDTIETGAKIHGFGDKEINELVIRINEVIEYEV
jgi:hybrid cluster-associated redox disulfide protein